MEQTCQYVKNVTDFIYDLEIDKMSILDLISGDDLRHANIYQNIFEIVAVHEYSADRIESNMQNLDFRYIYGNVFDLNLKDTYSLISIAWPEESIIDFFKEINIKSLFQNLLHNTDIILLVYPGDKYDSPESELAHLNRVLFNRIAVGDLFERKIESLGFNIIKKQEYRWRSVLQNREEFISGWLDYWDKENLNKQNSEVIEETRARIGTLLEKCDYTASDSYRIMAISEN